MTTAIIGTGNIGGQVARHLVAGGERVVLAARDESHAAALANELGPLASAASVRQAIAGADVVVLAVWLDTTKELIAENGDLLHRKVVVDPSNPIKLDAQRRVYANASRRPVRGVRDRGSPPRRRSSREGFWHAGRRCTRLERQSNAPARSVVLRHG
jgi:predicted dinucleotide-binding enzyme